MRCHITPTLWFIGCLCLLAGCGGSNSAGSGRAVFTVVWPPSRLIPEASQSIRVSIQRNAVIVATRVIPRPAGGGPASADFQNLPVGQVTAIATAHPQANGSGVAQASGSVGFTVLAGQTTPFTLTMATTIDRIEVLPPDMTLNPGQVRQLTVSAKNAANEIVLISPNKLDWRSLNTAVATVDSLGRVTAQNAGSAQIRVTETESGRNAIATVDVTPAAGPKKIVFQRQRDGANWDIWVMNADGSAQTRITNGSASDHVPSWSPDGTMIVFCSTRDGNNEVYTMNADGSNQLRLTNNPADDYAPAFSPDGTKIIFSSTRGGSRQLYTMMANGSNQIPLTNLTGGPDEPSWSPNGSKIVFSTFSWGSSSQIYVMNSDGSGATAIATGTIPVWQSNARIVFMTIRDGNWEIYSMNADGSGQTNITRSAAYDSDNHCSSDGSKIAFYSNRDGGSHELYSMNADGSNILRLTNNTQFDSHPEWQW